MLHICCRPATVLVDVENKKRNYIGSTTVVILAVTISAGPSCWYGTDKKTSIKVDSSLNLQVVPYQRYQKYFWYHNYSIPFLRIDLYLLEVFGVLGGRQAGQSPNEILFVFCLLRRKNNYCSKKQNLLTARSEKW